VRVTGDTIACSPPLIVEEGHIEKAVETLRTVLRA
jgi:adenosylmethionine-8-amino-7-oxononanoate aminotransferase